MHNSGYAYNIITMTEEIKAHLIKGSGELLYRD